MVNLDLLLHFNALNNLRALFSLCYVILVHEEEHQAEEKLDSVYEHHQDALVAVHAPKLRLELLRLIN